MKRAWIAAAVMTAALLSGCARYFHAAAPAATPELEAGPERGAEALRLAPLPSDLAWLGSALRLYDAVEAGPHVRLAAGTPVPERVAPEPYAAADMTGGAPASAGYGRAEA